MMESDARLMVGDLAVEVRHSARRKTLELTVDRGGELIVTSPPGVSEEVLADFVRQKRFWIYTKLAAKEAMQRPRGGKEFVSGEGFAYLGRSYRLLLVEAQEPPLRLEAGRFKLARDQAATGRQHFVRWYTEHARHWMAPRVAGWAARMELQPTGVEVRDLGYRWGSCSPSGRVNFHWATILLPPGMVDYVIVHELVHLVVSNHTEDFWQRVGRAMPDYAQRKAWLAEHGGRLAEL
jgi:predicted metal-dependent hydrolase